MVSTKDALLKRIDKATALLQDSIVKRCPFYGMVGLLLDTLSRGSAGKKDAATIVRKMQLRAAQYPWTRESAFAEEFREQFDAFYHTVPQTVKEARDVVLLEIAFEEELVKLKLATPIEKAEVREKWNLLPATERKVLRDRIISVYEANPDMVTTEKQVTRRRLLFAILVALQHVPVAAAPQSRPQQAPVKRERDDTANPPQRPTPARPSNDVTTHPTTTGSSPSRLATLPQNKQEYEHFDVSPVGHNASDAEDD